MSQTGQLRRFATTLLDELGIRPGPENVRALVGWARAEGGHFNNTARFNPLNTTQGAPGAGNTGAQGNIKAYRDWQQGVDATARTLRNGRYGNILSALQHGTAGDVASAIARSPWGTSGSLISSVIGSTPRLGPTQREFGGGSGQHTTTPGPLTTALSTPGLSVTPGPDTTALLQQLLEQGQARPASSGVQAPAYAAHATLPQGYQGIQSAGGPAPKQDLSGLLEAASGLGGAVPVLTPGSVPGDAQNASVRPRSVSAKAGVTRFDGTPVAAWIKPALRYAREHGWRGTVTSGFRTREQQAAIYNSGVRPAAKPGTSNHEGDVYPRGAVDVSDAQQLAAILRDSPYRNKLVWAGAKDPVHFSHPHGGGY